MPSVPGHSQVARRRDRTPTPAVLPFVGVASVILAGGGALWVTDTFYFGSAELDILNVAPLLPVPIALLTAVAAAICLRLWWSGILVVATAAPTYLVYLAMVSGIGLGSAFQGPPDATGSLIWDPNTGGVFKAPYEYANGFLHFSAAVLNRVQPAQQAAGWGHITYVRWNQPSTGTYVVSVYPIGRNSWSAVALSSLTGTCYAELDQMPSRTSRPSFGVESTAILSGPEPCIASRATIAKVSGRHEW